MKSAILKSLVGCASLAVGCAHSSAPSVASDAAQQVHEADATLVPLNNSKVSGTLTFVQLSDGGVRVEGKIAGLAPNTVHGFHVHENGDCGSVDGKSAGGHFNPSSQPHGALDAVKSHGGDLGNIQSDAAGNAMVLVIKQGVTVASGEGSITGRSIIVHQKRDDFISQPTGDSGDRIGCGVIRAH